MARKAASILLHRDRDGLEVYLVERSPALEFFGGYHALPGGGVEQGDATVPLEGAASENAGALASLGCAARELLEETGILVSRGPSPPGFAATLRGSLDGAGSGRIFDRRLREAGLAIDAAAFEPATRFVTPRFSRIRFDTQFYFLETDAEPRIIPGELASGRWWRPADALGAWCRGEIHVAPPALVILRCIVERGLHGALAELRAMPPDYEGSGAAIPWTPGIEILPLHCAPLPAVLPTNAFLVGTGRFLVVDPGPGEEEPRQHLLTAIRRRVEAGDQPEAVFLTHHHIDHVAALDVVAECFELPVWGHPITGELLERKLDRELEEGDWIDLGAGPDGREGWGCRVIFTPGHARGHLALLDERYRVLIAGDLVSTLVSMYVGSPGGHLATYFDTLERLRGLDLDVLCPSHGTPTLRVRELLEKSVMHRCQRTEEVERALSEEGVSVEALAGQIYRDVDPRLREMYTRSTRATLEYLVEEGRAARRGDDLYARRRVTGAGGASTARMERRPTENQDEQENSDRHG